MIKRENELENCKKSRVHYKWTIGVLIALIIQILTFKFWGKQDSIIDLISIASGLVSIALAIVAIFIALSESVKTSLKEDKVDLALNKIIDNTKKMEEILDKNHSSLKNKLDDIAKNFQPLINAWEDHGQEHIKENVQNPHSTQTSVGENDIPSTIEVTKNKNKQTFRGNVYIADLGAVEGSEMGSLRPVIIVSNEINNRYSPTVTIVPITGQLQKPKIPTHVEIEVLNTKNGAVNIALVDQVRTIDRKRLENNLLVTVDENTMKKIDQSIMIHMGLIDLK